MKPESQTPGPTGEPASGDSGQSKSGHQRSKIQRIWAYRHLWIVGVLVFAADQITKQMIADRLPFGSYGTFAQIEVIPGFFNLVHVGNTGAAWSMFTGQSLWLAVLAIVTLGAMFWWRHTLGLQYRAAQPAFGLLVGGVVGNIVDRLAHGHVIDFLDFHFGGYVFPTFNVADSGICVGVFWYILWSLRQPAEPAAAK
ncbi:signal peptidase II [Oleiharenicola lentus]|uniref:signal peptidase II n=1 Tax=Oleiharenicola lentus TaxID=2508720 RepID=UPI0024830A6C|nr:signal peptidase II [Oleiharenicola lentus]